jgi:Ca2+-binding EF-hand superfamily protein
VHLLPLDSTDQRRRYFRLISQDGQTVSEQDLIGFFYELSFNVSKGDCRDFINSISLDDKSHITFEEFDRIVTFSMQLQDKRRQREQFRAVDR